MSEYSDFIDRLKKLGCKPCPECGGHYRPAEHTVHDPEMFTRARLDPDAPPASPLLGGPPLLRRRPRAAGNRWARLKAELAARQAQQDLGAAGQGGA